MLFFFFNLTQTLLDFSPHMLFSSGDQNFISPKKENKSVEHRFGRQREILPALLLVLDE